ncbi:hypothetical protein LWI28_024157 [Acer negundo]|uniref:Uncharacterized protein n=1 Tax=Acer negundo TaxID=4023 RepID=A0AAD5J6F6_ACENE|nr:hypothetical protein LWI28_000523 [Acer negundo]KAI9187079.1 hypothetical protein LWI28_024157 [Acer negundo]
MGKMGLIGLGVDALDCNMNVGNLRNPPLDQMLLLIDAAAMAGPREHSYEEAARLDCSYTFCCTMASVIPPEILAPASSTYDIAAVAACLGFP